MTWIDRGLSWFWGRVANTTTIPVEGLAILRIALGLYFLLMSAPYTHWVGLSPPTFFDPPRLSVMNLFSGFPSTGLMRASDTLSLVLSACVLLGIRARAATLLFLVVGVLQSNATMCYGKISHDGMQWALLGCMAFSGWGRDLALVPDKPSKLDQPARALALLGVCLAFAMAAAGLTKAGRWLDLDLKSGGFLAWFVRGYFVDNRHELLAPYVLSIPPIGLKLMDYTAVAFETGCAVALLVGPRTWRVWLMAACAFHLVNTLTLNIPFLQNVLVYLAFVDFSAVQSRLAKWWSKPIARGAFAAIGAAMVIAHLVLRRVGVGRWFFFVFDENDDTPFVLRVSLVVWASAFAIVWFDLRRRQRERRQQHAAVAPQPEPQPADHPLITP